MKIDIPKKITKDSEKLEYLFRVHAKLIEAHNLKGANFKNSQISKKEFDGFVKDWFEPKIEAVHSDMLEIKQAMQSDSKHDIDIDLENLFTVK